MKRKSTRIIFRQAEVDYKFASFFVDKNDNSFYFHLYEEADANYKSYNLSAENGATKIEFDNFKEHDFKRNKLSIHPSGYVHSTDRNGKRLKDNIIGIPFVEIETSKLILVLAPKKIDELIKIDPVNPLRDIIIILSKDINPFTLNFEIFKKSELENLATDHENNLIGGYIEVTIDDKDYGIRFYLQSVNGKGDWPDFSIVLTRVG